MDTSLRKETKKIEQLILGLDIPLVAYHNALDVSLLVAILVIIDILTKWFGVVDKYNNDNGLECNGYNTFRGVFFRAWEDGYLESRKFREELGRKTKAYVMTIILGIVVYLLPDYTINGMVADETLSFLIYLAMVVAECFSIAENLKDMGVSQASFIMDSILSVLQKAGITVRRDDDKK